LQAANSQLLVIEDLQTRTQARERQTSYPVWLSRIPLNLSAVTSTKAR
jgi:hypothetical protein